MRMKFLLVIFAFALLLFGFTTAYADNYTVTTGSTLTISTVGPHTVTGTATNASIVCSVPGVTLTLDGVSVTCDSGSAITFTGSGNTMILAAGTTNTFRSNGSSASVDNAAIRVENTTELTISGTGTLNAYGGEDGAGIGGGRGADCGIVTINDGTINAHAGYAAAAIGGGSHVSGDGVGSAGDGGTITINGGTITAYGGYEEGVGIGGGYGYSYTSGTGGIITITGGTVVAYAGEDSRGAAIGGGYYAGAGTITISGGLVYAERYSAANDIGAGYGGTGGSVTIEGDAAVFLYRNSILTPSLPDGHENKLEADYNANNVYGVVVPSSAWTSADGAYFRLCTVSYDANGGTGTLPDSLTQHYNTTVSVDDGSSLSNGTYTFNGWNTAAAGTGITYTAGSDYTFNSTLAELFAQWIAMVTPTPEADDTSTTAVMPQTGDTNHHLALYVVLAGLSMTIAITVGLASKKQKNHKMKH